MNLQKFVEVFYLSFPFIFNHLLLNCPLTVNVMTFEMEREIARFMVIGY